DEDVELVRRRRKKEIVEGEEKDVCSGWFFQFSLEVPPPLMFPVTVTPLGRDQDCSLKNREPEVLAPWFLDPGGWSKTAAVNLYFIFPGICTLSLSYGERTVRYASVDSFILLHFQQLPYAYYVDIHISKASCSREITTTDPFLFTSPAPPTFSPPQTPLIPSSNK
ncbi:hypothetical protein STEG23_010707, partial [Scotinomys teguina]